MKRETSCLCVKTLFFLKTLPSVVVMIYGYKNCLRGKNPTTLSEEQSLIFFYSFNLFFSLITKDLCKTPSRRSNVRH